MSSLLRFLLLPFSILYGTGVFLRNKLFDLNIRKSVSFDLPVIVVGNLSAGGTGKTPHVEYLIRLLREKYKIGMMSRGYKRKTKGYFLVDENSSASEAGDEPLQIKRKFSNVTVAVCEERVMGIPNMLADDPSLQIIILDDAFQHRNVKAGLSVLLTEYSKPYSRDRLIPAGRLREWRSGADRADVIIVSKGPSDLTSAKKKIVMDELQPKLHQQVFFSTLSYDTPYHIFHPEKKICFKPGRSCAIILWHCRPRVVGGYS